MKNPSDNIAIGHKVLAHENFDRTAQILLRLLSDAQQQQPGKKRYLYLEIDGHRNSEGGFDSDMYELQSKFMAEFLIRYLVRAETPLGTFQNPKPQSDDIPERLDLIQVDRPAPGGSPEFKTKP